METKKRAQRGQALVMVTLALIAMCGMLGLAVDLSWSYFVRRNGQAFSDSGAFAAVEEAYRVGGKNSTAYCGRTGIACNAGTPASCASAGGNLANGCLYLQGVLESGGTYTGFVDGSNGSRTQTATIESGDGRLTVSGGATIDTYYWARARVSEQIPQLFSALMGHPMATVAAGGTAAIVGIPIDASLVLLNRVNESAPVGPGGGNVRGKNLYIQGSGGVRVPSGIRLSANKALAGEIGSGGTVSSSYTWTMAKDGTTTVGPNWSPHYMQKTDVGQRFQDPLGGVGQPPLKASSPLPDCPVPGGLIDGGTTPVLAPGNYYATDSAGNPTWQPVKVKGNVTFAAASNGTNSTVFTYQGKTTASCKMGLAGTSNPFGSYFIYGGLTGQGSGVTMTVEPGQYVLAGVNQGGNASQTNNVLGVNPNISLLDTNSNNDPPSSPSIHAGEMFILTRPDYPGVSTQITSIPNLSGATSNLDFGSTMVQAGTQTKSLQLHGLTPGRAPDDSLKPFESVLFWQDQRNSPVKYNSDGTINVSGGPGCNAVAAGGVDINNPCTNNLSHPNSPQFTYQGGANTQVYGIYYQPRGAWMLLQGGGQSVNANKTMIISGALQIGGSSVINFGPLTPLQTERLLVLVE